jgi:hypothetical protein
MDAAAPGTSLARRWLPDVLLLLVLAALTLKLSYHISEAHDLTLDDETNYMAHGHFLSSWGLPPACYSPLYVLWYWAWDRLHLDRTFVYFANWAVLMYLLAAGQYVLVRALGGLRAGALLLSFLTLNSGLNLVLPYPMHLATVVLLSGCVVAARLRSWPSSLFALGTALAVAAFLRPELSFSFLLCAASLLGLGGWSLVKRRAGAWRPLLYLALLLVFAAALAEEFGNPLGGGRSYFAFGQHYAFNLHEHKRIDVDPWTNWEAVARADFGDAESVPQAMRNNPRAFVRHVAWNVAEIPFSVTFLTAVELGFWHRAVRTVTVIIAVVGVVGFFRRMFRRSVRESDQVGRPLHVAVVMLLFIAAPTVASVLVIHPRMHYLLPLIVFGSVLAFAGYAGFPEWLERARRLDAPPALAALVLLLAVFMPNWAHRWSLQQVLRSRPLAPAVSLEVERTVAVMRGLGVRSPEPIVVLESGFSRAFYAGWDFTKVDHWTKAEGFRGFVAGRNISVVVLDERLRADPRFRDDPEFRAFAAEQSGDFRFFDVPGTDVRVAVRADLLPAPVARSGP